MNINRSIYDHIENISYTFCNNRAFQNEHWGFHQQTCSSVDVPAEVSHLHCPMQVPSKLLLGCIWSIYGGFRKG